MKWDTTQKRDFTKDQERQINALHFLGIECVATELKHPQLYRNMYTYDWKLTERVSKGNYCDSFIIDILDACDLMEMQARRLAGMMWRKDLELYRYIPKNAKIVRHEMTALQAFVATQGWDAQWKPPAY